MRSLLTFAVVAGLALSALADDPPKVPAPKVVTQAEWAQSVLEIESGNSTTIEKVKKYRAISDGVVIQCSGRIGDIKPTQFEGKDTALIVVIAIESDVVLARFVVPPDEAAVASEWRKEDRLSWRERPTVNSEGKLERTPIYKCLADLTHSDAIEEPVVAVDLPGDDLVPYTRWLKKYVDACCARDWTTATTLVKTQPGWTLRAKAGTPYTRNSIRLNFSKSVSMTGRIRGDGRLAEDQWGLVSPTYLAGISDDDMKKLKRGTLLDVFVIFDVGEPYWTTGVLSPRISLVKIYEPPPPPPAKK